MLPHSTRPSPTDRRVGIHNFTFEACSGFTRVTARWIAQPPKAAFVTGLRDGQLPDRPARQLPDQPTTLCVASSSTGDSRLRGALSVCGYNSPSQPPPRHVRSTPNSGLMAGLGGRYSAIPGRMTPKCHRRRDRAVRRSQDSGAKVIQTCGPNWASVIFARIMQWDMQP